MLRASTTRTERDMQQIPFLKATSSLMVVKLDVVVSRNVKGLDPIVKCFGRMKGNQSTTTNSFCIEKSDYGQLERVTV